MLLLVCGPQKQSSNILKPVWQNCYSCNNILYDFPHGFPDSTVSRFVSLSAEKRLLWRQSVPTFGNCQSPVFSLGVSQHMHKITNLWKFGLNWSLKLQEDNERKKQLCCTNLCAFRCPKTTTMLLQREQCFKLSTALWCSLPNKFLR